MSLHDRRAFLRMASAAGVAWAAADLLQVEDALAWAAQSAGSGGARETKVLTKDQADTIDAVAARILPAVDGRPGAHEAGAVYFIDRALSTFNADQRKLYVDGIADLNRRAARKWKAAGFAALTNTQQDVMLRDIEKTKFFEAVRMDTIFGTFALPKWGGNSDYAGWHLLEFAHQPSYQAPFGYYDTDANPGKDPR